MRHTTKDTFRTAGRGVFGAMFAIAIVTVVVFASGDSAAVSDSVSMQRSNDNAVAGVLLSPRTRLIIDYQRVALA